MKDGNWISLDKNLAKNFPDREFSIIEAAFSLTMDYDNNRPVTAAGYAKLWRWSRTKVNSFLARMKVEIIYPENTGKKQNQKGQIKRQIEDRSKTDREQIRMVDTKCFNGIEDRSRTDQEQIKNRSKNTTNKPNTILNHKPNKKPLSKNHFDADCREMKISKYFFAVLQKSRPSQKEPNWQNWCLEIAAFIKKENPSNDEIKLVINFAHDPDNSTDKFSWIPNLRSPKKLRQHFDQILLQSKQKVTKKKSSQADEIAEMVKKSFGNNNLKQVTNEKY